MMKIKYKGEILTPTAKKKDIIPSQRSNNINTDSLY